MAPSLLCRPTREDHLKTRQARIKPAYQEWFPKIQPGVWHNAAWLVEMVLQQQRRGSPTWALEGRVLRDEHVEFQGYGPFSRPSQQTRQTDIRTHD
jgi:hypothetical protein